MADDDNFTEFLNQNKFYEQNTSAIKYSALRTIALLIATLSCSAFLVWAVTITILYAQKSPAVEAERQADPYQIDFITFNDCYEIAPVTVTINDYQEKRGGASRVAAYIKNARRKNKRTLVLAGGDFISPSVGSTLFQGQQMLSALNTMGLNYSCYGNHEFDFGVDVLRERVLETTNFKWISSNILDTVTGSRTVFPQVLENTIVDFSPAAKIGIFGLVYDLFSTSIKVNNTRYKYLDARTVAMEQVAKLKQNGATFIIALTHMAASDNCALGSVPGLDLIISGHDHNVKTSDDCGGAAYFTATQDWQNIWHLSFNFSTPFPSYKADSIPITMNMPVDPQTEEVIVKYDALMQQQFAVTLGTTTTNLDSRSSLIRQQETGLANFVTDVIREFTSSDVAVINGGGIRGNRIILPGEVKKGDIFSWFPFGNVIGGVYVNSTILSALVESSLSRYQEIGGSFLQVSNLKYTFDPARPIGSRLVSLTFFNGTALPANRVFKLATTDYLISGGDAINELAKNLGTFIDPREGELLTGVIMNAIKTRRTISPVIEGRITKL